MRLFNKNFDLIDAQDILKLIEYSVAEDDFLDFKAELHLKSKSSDKTDPRHEFAKDINSFANANGGILIIGIKETKNESGQNIATEIVGFQPEGCSKDEFIRKIRDACEYAIKAPHPPYPKARFIEVEPGKEVLLLKIEKSFDGPHWRTHDDRFHIRQNSQSVPMTYQQLKNQFVMSDSIFKQFEQWRQERIEYILSPNGLHAQREINHPPLIVIHMASIAGLQNQFSIDWEQFFEQDDRPENSFYFMPLLANGLDKKFSFEGRLYQSYFGSNSKELHYSLIFKSGFFETISQEVDLSFKDAPRSRDAHCFSGKQYINAGLQKLRNYKAGFQLHGIPFPVLISVSLLNMKDYIFFQGFDHNFHNSNTFGRNLLNLPIQVWQPDQPAEEIWEPITQQLAMASGLHPSWGSLEAGK